MTVIVSVSAPAPAAASFVAHFPASENGGHGFSAALDALTAGEGKAKSTDEGDKRTADDAADVASARPSADLRAALMGGALASLPLPSKAAAADAAPPVSGVRGIAPSLLSDCVSDASALAYSEAGAAPAGPKSLLGATVTAERAYIAPAVFANALDGAARAATPAAAAQPQAQGPAISAAGAMAPGQRGAGTASTPPIAATVAPPGKAASAVSAAEVDVSATASARTAGLAPPGAPAADAASAVSAVSAAEAGVFSTASAQTASLAPPVTPPVATVVTFARDEGATAPAASSTTAAASFGASAVEPPPLAAATAPPRSAPRFARATGTTHAAGAGSAARAAASAASAAEAKTDAREAANPGAAGGQGANAPVQGAPSTNLFGAAAALAVPAQADAALSTSSAPSTPPAAQTSPSAAAVPAAQRVHEIDLDLAPGGVADVSMTVRLAGDKLGVVIRAASGETAATIEGARDAIAERLAAIGQPVSSIIIQQTGASDATGGSGQSAGEGEGRAQQGQNGEAGDSRGSRRGASRF